jgi:hypothetical protein
LRKGLFQAKRGSVERSVVIQCHNSFEKRKMIGRNRRRRTGKHEAMDSRIRRIRTDQSASRAWCRRVQNRAPAQIVNPTVNAKR